MKRDMELVRAILLKMEESETAGPKEMHIDGYDDADVLFHCWLMRDGGLINGFDIGDNVRGIFRVQPWYIKWEGYEFLEAAKNEDWWNQAKARLGGNIKDVSLAVLTSLLVEIAKQQLGIS